MPVFNLKPEGEPARFGFEVRNVPVVLTTHVRSGSDYGIEVTVNEAPESAAVLQTQLTLWGVPRRPPRQPSVAGNAWRRGLVGDQKPPCRRQTAGSRKQ